MPKSKRRNQSYSCSPLTHIPSTSSQLIKIITQAIRNCSHLIIPREASIRTRKWRSGPSPAPSPLHCAALPARSPAKSHTHTELSRRRIAWRTTCSAKATSNASQQAKTLPGGQNALTRTTHLPIDRPERDSMHYLHAGHAANDLSGPVPARYGPKRATCRAGAPPPPSAASAPATAGLPCGLSSTAASPLERQPARL